MSPDPRVVQLDPEEATHDQVAPSKTCGRTSDTVADGTSSGPALETTPLYVSGGPGITVLWPSSRVTPRSASTARNSSTALGTGAPKAMKSVERASEAPKRSPSAPVGSTSRCCWVQVAP